MPEFMHDPELGLCGVKGLTSESIPEFIREYVENYAKPTTDTSPELAASFYLPRIIEDVVGVLDSDLEADKKLPILFVLWTNMVTAMARIEVIMHAQES